MSEKEKRRILKDRKCIICGKKIDVELGPNGEIPDGYWFSNDLLKDLTGKADIEYWECRECSGFKDDLIMKAKVKQWMEHYWGTKCPDYEEDCCLCRAWRCYDYIFDIEETEPESTE